MKVLRMVVLMATAASAANTLVAILLMDFLLLRDAREREGRGRPA